MKFYLEADKRYDSVHYIGHSMTFYLHFVGENSDRLTSSYAPTHRSNSAALYIGMPPIFYPLIIRLFVKDYRFSLAMHKR